MSYFDDDLFAQDDAQPVDDEFKAPDESEQPAAPAAPPSSGVPFQMPSTMPSLFGPSASSSSVAAAPAPQAPAPSPSPSMPAPSAVPSLFGTPAAAPQTDFIQSLRDRGLWGPQYGAPVGQGDVEIGGGTTTGQPAYIQSVTTAPGRSTAAASARPASQPNDASSVLPTTMDTSTREANLRQWAPALQRLQDQTGLNAGALGAIIVAENGGGQSPLSAKANNYFSIAAVPGNKWQSGTAPGGSTNPTMGVYATPQDNLNHFVDMMQNDPRYAQAWQDRANPEKFWDDLVKAGYIEDDSSGHWRAMLRSGKDQYESAAESAGAGIGVQAQAATNTTTAAISKDLQQGTPNLDGITPSQQNYALNSGDSDGWAMCSLFAASGELASLGINVAPADMKGVARQVGWTAGGGQAGPAAHAQMVNTLLQQNGSTAKAYVENGIDWRKIASEVQSGRPVALSSPGSNGHYFVVEGYDPSTGKYNLGNSLLSLKAGNGTSGWVTPNELAALQSVTSINMNPTAAIYLSGGTPARSGASSAPAAAPAATRPTAATSAPGVQTTMTTPVQPTAPTQVVRSNLNRPLTLSDMAYGHWNAPPAPVVRPPQVQINLAPPAAPARSGSSSSSGSSGIPVWQQEAAARARADAAAKPTEAQTAQNNALDKESTAREQWIGSLDDYTKQADAITAYNAQQEKDYREAINRSSEGTGNEDTLVRPTPVEIPPLPQIPATPAMDALIATKNAKLKADYDAAVARGETPEAPKYIKTLTEIRDSINTQTAEMATAPDKVKENWDITQHNIFAEQGQAIEAARVAQEAEDTAARHRQDVITDASPRDQTARLLEANEANGSGSVTLQAAPTQTEIDNTIIPRPTVNLQPTSVVSRPEDVDALPEPSQEQIEAARRTARVGEDGLALAPTSTPEDPLRDDDPYHTTDTTLTTDLPDVTPQTVEQARIDSVLARQGLYTPTEKERIKGQLAENISTNESRELDTQGNTRSDIPTTVLVPTNDSANPLYITTSDQSQAQKEIDNLPENEEQLRAQLTHALAGNTTATEAQKQHYIDQTVAQATYYTPEQKAAFATQWKVQNARDRAGFFSGSVAPDDGKPKPFQPPFAPVAPYSLAGTPLARPGEKTQSVADSNTALDNRGTRNVGLLTEGVRGIESSTGAVGEGLSHLIDSPSLQTWGAQVVRDSEVRDYGNIGLHPDQGLRGQTLQVDPNNRSVTDNIIGSLPGTLVGTVIAIPVTAAIAALGAPLALVTAVGLGVGALTTFVQEGGQGYLDAIKGGASPTEAAGIMLARGAVNASIEVSPVGKLLGKIPGASSLLHQFEEKVSSKLGIAIANRLSTTAAGREFVSQAGHLTEQALHNFMVEGGQEALQEAVGYLGESFYQDKDISELWDRMKNAALVGGVMGVGTEGLHAGVERLTEGHAALHAGVEAGMASERSGTHESAIPSIFPPGTTFTNAPAPAQTAVNPATTTGAATSTPSAPAVPGVARQLQGIDQPLMSVRGYDADGNPVYNQNNLNTQNTPDWEAAVNQNTTMSPEVTNNTAKPGQRIPEAVKNLVAMEGATGGLNPDQRAALLDDYGIDTADARTIAAVAAYHISQNPDDEALINGVLAGMFKNESGSKTLQTFQTKVNQALANRVPARPAAAPATAPASPAAPAASAPAARPTFNVGDQITNGQTTGTVRGHYAAAGVQGVLMADGTGKLIQVPYTDAQHVGPASGVPSLFDDGSTPAAGPATTSATTPENSGAAPVQNGPVTAQNQPVVPSTGLENLQTSGGPATASEGPESLKTAPSEALQAGPSAAPSTTPSTTIPGTTVAGTRPSQAPVTLTPVAETAVPPGARIVDGTSTVTMTRKPGNFMYALEHAVRNTDVGGNWTRFLDNLKALRPTTGRRALTVADVVQHITDHYQSTPEIAASILDKLGIDGIKTADGTQMLSHVTQTPGVTPTQTSGVAPTQAPTQTQGTPLAGKPPRQAVTAAPTVAQAPAVPREADVPPGLRRVWVTTPNGHHQHGQDIGGGRDRVIVHDTPHEAGLRYESSQQSPILVPEGDVHTGPNGETYIPTRNGSYTPLMGGVLAQNAPNTYAADSANAARLNRRGSTEGVGQLDLINHSGETAAGTPHFFQQGEVAPEQREQIAHSDAMTSTGTAIASVFGKIKNEMAQTFPSLLQNNTFRGLAWMPQTMGVTKAFRNSATMALTRANTFFNPHALYSEALAWASEVGIAPNSDQFRRFLAELHVGTIIHELAHTLPESGVDIGGHGGSHAAAIQQILDTHDLDAYVAEMYHALTPEVMAETQQQMGDLEESVGKPAPAQTQTAQAPPAASSPSGLRLGNGDSRGGSYDARRTAQRLKSAITDHFAEENRNNGQNGAEARANAYENIKDYDQALSAERVQNGTPGSRGLNIATVKNMHDALQTAYGPEAANEIARRAGMDGYTYTDEQGKKQTFTYPHAQEGAQNGTTSTTQARGAGDHLRPAERSDVNGEPQGSDGPREYSARAQRQQSPESVRSGSQEVSEPADVRQLDGSARPGGYVPGTNVHRNTRTGEVARSTKSPTRLGPKEFWSPSQGKAVRWDSRAEYDLMQRLEAGMHTNDPALGPHGEVAEWRRGENWDGSKLATPYYDPTTRTTREFRPDFLVAYKDGHQEIIEVKQTDALQEEDPFYRSEAKREEGLNTARGDKHVKGKSAALIANLPMINPGVETHYRIIAADDPLVTGRDHAQPRHGRFIDAYQQISDLSKLAYTPEMKALQDDPEQRWMKTYQAARDAIIKIDGETVRTTEGSIRNAPSMTFIAHPDETFNQDLKNVRQVAPNAATILEEGKRDGLQTERSAYGEDPRTGARTSIIQTTGDIEAAELQGAKLAKDAGTESLPGTFGFHEDSRGDDYIHSMSLPDSDDAVSSALAGLVSPSGPTITTLHGPDGTVDQVVMSSRTPDGERLTAAQFNKSRDNLLDTLHGIAVHPEDNYTARGKILRFDDPAQGGIDNVIATRQESLGKAPLGSSLRPSERPGPNDIPVGTPRGRPARQYIRSDSLAQTGTELHSHPGQTTPDFRGVPDAARAGANPATTSPATTNPVAAPGEVAETRARQQNPPGQPGQPQTPQQQVQVGRVVVPNLNLKRFSRDAQAPIRAAAMAIHAAGGPPANIQDVAAHHLGITPQEFANSPASKLSPIELAAVVQNLTNARANLDNMATHFADPATPDPTPDELRDFIQHGIRFQAMHNQLRGSTEAVNQGSRQYTQTKQRVQQGETPQQHLDRILAYAKTSSGAGKTFARDLIGSFHAASMLGASAHQIGESWSRILDPKTTIGDWATGVMYSGMLAARSAGTALIGNTWEVNWRLTRDLIAGIGNAAKYGPAEAGNQLNLELKGWALGFGRGLKAMIETVRYGATKSQLAMNEVPIDRLQHNDIFGNKILSTAADKIGWTMETFFGRFFSAADSFARTWSMSMELGRLAAAESRKFSANGKMDMTIAENLFNNPTEAMLTRANQVGKETVFQNEMGRIGNDSTRFQNWPVIGRMVMPLLKTTYNTMARAVDRSPLGFIGAMIDIIKTSQGDNLLEKVKNAPSTSTYLQGTSTMPGARPANERLMDSVMGSAVTALIGEAFSSGLIDLTGEPPDDEKERLQWQRQHKTAYSISVRGGPYISYASWGPPAVGMMALAEASRAKNRTDGMDPTTASAIAGAHFAKGLLNTSYLSTMAGMLDAVNKDSPDSKFLGSGPAGMAEDFLTSRIPFGAPLLALGQAQDAYVRYPDADTLPLRMAQDLSSRMPLHVPFSSLPIHYPLGGQIIDRATLHPQLDVWGFPVENPYGGQHGLGWADPVRWASLNPHDHVDEELASLHNQGVDVLPTKAGNSYKPSEAESPHTFTVDERFEWQRRVGQDSYARLVWLFGQQSYKDAPLSGAGSKEAMVKAMYTEAQKTAWKSMSIVDPGKEPQREPLFYGIKEEAAQRGIPWWQLEGQVNSALGKWADYRDAVKTGREPPTMTPDEVELAGQYSNPGARNRGLQMDQKEGSTSVKKVDDGYTGIPFTALPPGF